MAIVAPFRGITYDLHRKTDLSKVMAPPYDVISAEEQDRYHSEDPHNVIRLILGKKRAGDSDWDNTYTRAADYFERWQSEHVLVRSPEPCLYVTAMTYAPGPGEPERVRWGIIALVRIEDPDSGVILPHERTFSAHKDDRLRLYRACNAQFSQIFGLYEDPGNQVLAACSEATGGPPLMDFHLKEGHRHRLWTIRQRAVFKQVSEAMAPKAIFIADGHHRYETARNYRDIMRARHGRRPENRSYEFVMMYLSSMNDRGLTILPSHRLIKRVPGFDLDGFLQKAARWFEVASFPLDPANLPQVSQEIRRRLEEGGEYGPTFGWYVRGGHEWRILRLKPGMGEEMGDDLHPSLKALDVLVLSRLIFQKGFGFTKEDLDDEEIFHYQSTISTALGDVASGKYQMVFFLNPTRMEQITAVAGNGLVMPRKSTYFYPKVLTGLVMNRIDPEEIIDVP